MQNWKRITHNENNWITVDGRKVRITEYIDQGSTCLAYFGELEDGRRVVVKEFFPNMPEIEREQDGSVRIYKSVREFTEYKRKRKQFETGYMRQKELATSNAMEVVVRPVCDGEYGDTSYIVSEAHNGISLEKVVFNTLASKLECAMRVAEMLGILHEAGYILTDFKPENILFISQLRTVNLIDTDSIISLKDNLEDLDTIYANEKYRPPEIELLCDCLKCGISIEEKKDSYLVPQGNVYCAGLYVYELLFQRPYTGKERLKELVKELYAKHREELQGKDNIKHYLEVILKSMSEEVEHRFKNGYELWYAMKEWTEKITAEQYTHKKEIAKANYIYLAYDVLEKNPLYKYLSVKNSEKILETLMAGEHAFREHYLKACISTAQLLDTKLHVHILAKDVEEFWKKLMEKNPELCRTVVWDKDGRMMNSEEDVRESQIVNTPLAYIHLYTDDRLAKIKEVIKENEIRHMVFLNENDEENRNATKSIIKRNARCFVGFLSRTEEQIEKAYSINVYRISANYNEKLYKEKMFQSGLRIHEYYYRSYNGNSTDKEIYDDYKSNYYFVENSERAALHNIYKLVAANIDPESPEVYQKFQKEIMEYESKKDIFDKLVMLEHRSWTAYMVLSGTRSADREEIFRYAFEGKNNWKEVGEKHHVIRHPCLIASDPGCKLTEEIWKNRQRLATDQLLALDPLDQKSLEVYDVICEKAKQKIQAILLLMSTIQMFLPKDNIEVQEAYHQLQLALEDIITIFGDVSNGKSSGCDKKYEIHCQNCISKFEIECRECNMPMGYVLDIFNNIKTFIKPVFWCLKYHDFKQGDLDVMNAMNAMLRSEQKG